MKNYCPNRPSTKKVNISASGVGQGGSGGNTTLYAQSTGMRKAKLPTRAGKKRR